MKFSPPRIAVMTCLATVGLGAGGCFQLDEAMGSVRKSSIFDPNATRLTPPLPLPRPTIDVPWCYRAPSPAGGCVGGG
jgi:hypothetical protein